MRAVVVYESMYGNTHLVAEAIGAGLARSSMPSSMISVARIVLGIRAPGAPRRRAAPAGARPGKPPAPGRRHLGDYLARPEAGSADIRDRVLGGPLLL